MLITFLFDRMTRRSARRECCLIVTTGRVKVRLRISACLSYDLSLRGKLAARFVIYNRVIYLCLVGIPLSRPKVHLHFRLPSSEGK